MSILKEMLRIKRLHDKSLKLSRFCREMQLVMQDDKSPHRLIKVGGVNKEMTDNEMIEKFKVKATGMIEELLEIISNQ